MWQLWVNAALALLCAKQNTSGVMTLISFLFYNPLLLIITHSYMETRLSDLITHPFRTCAVTDPQKMLVRSSIFMSTTSCHCFSLELLHFLSGLTPVGV